MKSISDFAENLVFKELDSIQEGKVLPPNTSVATPSAQPAALDIRNTEVPDDMMRQILGEDFHPQDTPTVDSLPELVWSEPEEEATPVAPSMISESTAQQLVPLLEEVKSLLLEMTAAATTSGQIGTNFAGGSTKEENWQELEKSYGYKLPTLSSKKSKSKKAILKQSLKDKVRRSK